MSEIAKKADLSIVIPVFNVEKYLPKCIDSLLRSDGIGDAEIIIVDDGSTDKSAEIADRYASEHLNIKVFHRENAGASSSRNFGLKQASGNYVFFCDSDDEVVPGLFSKVIEKTKNSDMDAILYAGDLIEEDGNKATEKLRRYFRHDGVTDKDNGSTGKEFLLKELKDRGDYPSVVWLGVYRKDFIEKNGLYFEDGISNEDDMWVPKMFFAAQKVCYIPERIYLYRLRNGSLSNPSEAEVARCIESLLYIYPHLYEYCEKNSGSEELKEYMWRALTRKYLYWIFEYDFFGRGYGKRVNIDLLGKTSKRFRDKIRVWYLKMRK